MSFVNIATFNVNSLRSRLPQLETWLESPDAPDVLCLQETKCQNEDFPKDFFLDRGYNVIFSGMKTYNGVAVASRERPSDYSFGLCDGGEEGREEEETSRVVSASFGDLHILNTYIPQGRDIESPEYAYKLRFFSRVRAFLEKRFTPEDKVLWVGDLNVAPTDLDVTNPKNKKNHVCFHEAAKDALANVMSWGFEDIFRRHLPNGGEFTFWDYRVKNALARNIGWRIDHINGTARASALCKSVRVMREFRASERPSDHTAVVAAFEM